MEHQFGSLKRQRGFTYTMVRGKEKVLGEVSMAFISYNLGRAMSIMGVEGLIDRIKRSKTYFFDFLAWTSCVSSNTTNYSYIYVQNYHEPWSTT